MQTCCTIRRGYVSLSTVKHEYTLSHLNYERIFHADCVYVMRLEILGFYIFFKNSWLFSLFMKGAIIFKEPTANFFCFYMDNWQRVSMEVS